MQPAVRAVEYIRAIERGAAGDEVAAFFAPDATIIEFPNRFSESGRRSDLAAARAAADRGRAAMQRQVYDITSVTADGDRVVLEIDWTGILAIPVGALAVGDAMRAHTAVILEFRDGKIATQRHYDCYEPF